MAKRKTSIQDNGTSIEGSAVLKAMPRAIFQNLAHLAATVSNSPVAYVSFTDDTGPIIIGNSESTSTPVTEAWLSKLLSQVLGMIYDGQDLVEFAHLAEDAKDRKPTYVSAISFKGGVGVTLGAITLLRPERDSLSTKELDALQTLAQQLQSHYETHGELITNRRIDAEFDQLLNNVDDAIYELDENGRFTLANAKTSELLQVAPSDLESYHIYDFVHPADLREVKAYHRDLIRNRRRRGYYELRVVPRLGGEPLWMGQQVTLEYNNRELRKVRAIARDLSIVKHLREALEERESQYKVLSENSRDIIGVLEKNGTYKYISHSVKEIAGYDPGEILGKIPLRFLHREDIPLIRKSLHSMVMGGRSTTNFECRIKKRNGEYIWVETYAKVIRGANGQITGFHTSARDISDRKRDANNLSLLIENTTDAVWAVDRQHKFMYFNSVFGAFYRKHTGQYPQIGLPLDWDQLALKEPNAPKVRFLTEALSGKKNTEEVQFGNEDHFIVYENSASPILNEDNHVIGVSVLSRDITASFIEKGRALRYQVGLRLLNDFAVQSMPLAQLFPMALQAICDHLQMPVGIISAIEDESYLIQYYASPEPPDFDPSATYRLESTYCQLVRHNQSVVLIDQASGWEYGGHPCFDPLTIQSYLGAPIKLEGEVIGTVNFISKKLRREKFTEYDGEFMQLFANWISTELTKEQTFWSLRKEKERAEAASIAKANFLSMMSHEVRTPLNGIIGTTNLLLKNCSDPRDARHLEILKKSGDHLQAIVTDILDFAKIEEGKVLLESKEFNLRETLENALANYQAQADEKNLELRLDYEGEASFYFGDQVRLNQIFYNLISNAIKFTHEGRILVRVRLVNRLANHDLLQLEVEDTGIGIAKSQRSEIFKVFAQADDSTTRKFGGSGLGLSITKKLLELMGSSIEVRSEEGQGTTFQFQLALKQADGASRPENRSAAIKGDLKGTVLIVEDNLFNRVIAKDFLQSWGLATVEAVHGKEALEILQEQAIDLVLLDIQMPILDGYGTVKWIRSQASSQLQLLPVIALTASALIEEQTNVYESGMNDFLTKPFVPEDFFRKIEHHLKHTDFVNRIADQTYQPADVCDPSNSSRPFDLCMETISQQIEGYEQAMGEGNMAELLRLLAVGKSNFQAMGLTEIAQQGALIGRMIENRNPANMIIHQMQYHLMALKKVIEQLFAKGTQGSQTQAMAHTRY